MKPSPRRLSVRPRLPRPDATTATLALTLWVGVGCSTAQPADADPATRPAQTRPAAAAPSAEPVRLTEVPPPPGVDPRLLAPIPGALRELATKDLDAILAGLDKPAFLRDAPPAALENGDKGEAAPPMPAPPLAAQQLYAAGRQAFRSGDNFLAVQQYEKALRLAPDSNAILNALGRAWAVAGNRVSAANYLRQAYAADPADLDSLLLLGRFALENRQWDEAIVTLAAAQDLAAGQAGTPEADPADAPLLDFLLANALVQAGYASAAVDAYQRYLAADRNYTRQSAHGRELMLIDAQRARTLVQLGDLHHRLGEPEAARDAYELATETGNLDEDDLPRRLVYTYLRLGQIKAAGDLAIRAAVGDGGQPRPGKATDTTLVRYAIDHGADAQQVSRRLREQYRDNGRPGTLAMVIADALPRDEAVTLLSEHLADKPGDVTVFGRLVRLLLNEGESDAQDRVQAVQATAAAIAASPESAEAYADQLLEQANDPAALLPAFDDPALTGDDAEHPAEVATLQGLTLAATGDDDAAADAFRRALDADADAGQSLARLRLAALAMQREDYDEADRLLQPLADADDPRVAALRVRALLQTGQDREALDLLDRMIREAGPATADGSLAVEKARVLLRLNRTEDAEQALLDALNIRPTDESIYEMLLAIYDEHGELQRNYQRLVRRMIDTIPDARITQLELARLQLASSDFAAAERSLDRVLAMDPNNLDAMQMLLELYIKTRRADAAGRLIDRHLDRNDGVINEELFKLAEAFFQRVGDNARWQALVQKRLLNEEVSLDRNLLLAVFHFQAGRIDDMLAVLREGLDAGLPIDQPANGINATLAQLYIAGLQSLEPADQAEARLRQAMRDYPRASAEVAYALAMIIEARGDTAGAHRVMQDALAEHPDHPQLNNALGYAWANAGERLDEAERMIEKAVAAEPEQAAYLDSLGWVYYKRGKFEDAVEQLRLARAQEGGTHPVIMDHLGDALYRLGRKAEAAQVWKEAQATVNQPGFASGDPEAEALPEKLEAKLAAVEGEGEPELAPVVQGDAAEAAFTP